jgi:hypothetical protein
MSGVIGILACSKVNRSRALAGKSRATEPPPKLHPAPNPERRGAPEAAEVTMRDEPTRISGTIAGQPGQHSSRRNRLADFLIPKALADLATR